MTVEGISVSVPIAFGEDEERAEQNRATAGCSEQTETDLALLSTLSRSIAEPHR